MPRDEVDPRTLSGSGGGGKKVTRTDDNLFSTDVVEVLLGVSEGPLKGVKNGLQSLFVGNTPLESTTGERNFDGFEVIFRKGDDLGEPIRSRLGGFASGTNVNSDMLVQGIPQVRTGLHTQIDFIDIRLRILRLVKETSKGTFQWTGRIKFEIRKTGTTTWIPVKNHDTDPVPPVVAQPENGLIRFISEAKSQQAAAAWDDYGISASSSPAPATNTIWFNSSDNYRPHRYNFSTNAWVAISGASRSGVVWTFSGGRKATYGTAAPATSRVTGDIWVNTTENYCYIFNGITWVEAGASYEPGRVDDHDTGGSSSFADGEIAINGKTTSGFTKEFRIPVDRSDTTYDIRVTRTSQDNTGELFFDVNWESFAEVVNEPYQFPGLSTLQIVARASDQFNSVPEFSAIYEGRIVKVPSNYNPVTRIYTGVWDGLWKLDYTNNPAFVGYDLVMNARYGMNAYYPVELNKWDVYEFGQFCDELAADGSPRFTFNGVIHEAQNGRDLVNYFFGAYSTRFFDDGNGYAVLRTDKNTPAVAIFGQENVVGGDFMYSQTSISTRHNDVTVTFINPDLNWAEDRRRVFDQDHIDTYGRIPHNFVAVGCTSAAEAIRRARYKLITGITERTQVRFVTNRAGGYLTQYDIILVADTDNGFGISGRVLKRKSNMVIKLREPIFLESGVTYQCSFTSVNTIDGGYAVATIGLATGQSGLVSEITFSSSMPAEVEDGWLFTLHTAHESNLPKPFRVLSIKPTDDNPDNVEISAVEVNRLKWDYIDGDVEEMVTDYFHDLRLTEIPKAVAALRVTTTIRKQGNTSSRHFIFDWDPSASKNVSHYRLSYSLNGSEFAQFAQVSSLGLEWPVPSTGNYVFSIEPVNSQGLKGNPTFAEFRMVSADAANLALAGFTAANDGTFDDQGNYRPAVMLNWGHYDGEITDYLIRWRKSSESIWSTTTTNLNYLRLPGLDGGASYTFEVTARDSYSTLAGPTTVTLAVIGDTNPPAVPIGFAVVPSTDGFNLTWTPNIDNDLSHYEIYVSATTTAPSSGTAATHQSYGTALILTGLGSAVQRHFWIRAVDRSKNKSDWSSRINATTQGLDWLTPDAAVPTGLTVTSTLESASGGAQFARIKVVWTAASNAEEYVVGVTSGGNEVTSVVTSTETSFRGLPGVLYQIRVRARNKVSKASAWTAVVSHTAIGDTTPPAVPTGLTVTGGYQHLWISWSANTEMDLSHYEVLEQSATTPAPSAGTTATYSTVTNQLVRSGLGANITRHYWIRAVDTSGNKSAWTARVQGTTVAGVVIDAGAISDVLAANPGIVPGSALAAKSVLTDKLVVTSTHTVNHDPFFEDEAHWTAPAQITRIPTPAGEQGGPFRLLAAAGTANNVKFTHRTPIDPTKTYLISGSIKRRASGGDGRAFFIVNFWNAAGDAVFDNTGWPGSNAVNGNHYFPTVGNIPTLTSTRHALSMGPLGTANIPAGAAYISLGFFFNYTSTVNSDTEFGPILVTEMARGEMIVDGSLEARHVGTNLLIANSANIGNAIILDAHIVELTAAKLKAGTALVGSLTVDGRALGNIGSWANDPAARINSGGTTDILPGKIVISGPRRLSDWLGTNDQTMINGGMLETNSVRTTSLRVEDRTNRIANGDFVDLSDPPGLQWAQNNCTLAWDTAEANLYGGLASIRMLRTNNASEASALNLTQWSAPVTPGEKIRVEIVAKAASAMAQGFGIRVNWTKADKSTGVPRVGHATQTYNDLVNNGALSNSWQIFSEILEVPPGASFARIHALRHQTTHATNHSIWLGRIHVTSAVGTLIEPGGIETNQLGADIVDAGRIRTNRLMINELLNFSESGALSASKTSAEDDTDGIYFGQSSDGSGGLRFVFSASRKDPSGRSQQISLTNSGFQLINARYGMLGAGSPTSYTRTSNLASTTLSSGSNTARMVKITQALGGGGGGSAGDARPGNTGGATIIELFDGSTLKRTITCNGAAGGTGDTRYVDRQRGANSVAGTGGANPSTGATGNPGTGYGSGGGGGGVIGAKPGVGGSAAQPVSTEWINVSGWTDPRIKITIGAGGNGGAANGSRAAGGNGAPGRVVYEVAYESIVDADVVPLTPTLVGNFSKGTGAGSFPDLGKGYWLIWYASSGMLEMNGIVTDPGVTVSAWDNKALGFFASVRPTYAAGGAARVIDFAFRKMGE